MVQLHQKKEGKDPTMCKQLIMYRRLTWLCSCMVAISGIAEQKKWNTTTGGDFNTPANWTPVGVPSTADYCGFQKTQSAPITMSQSVDVGSEAGRITWPLFPGNQFHGELALGEGNVLNLQNPYRISIGNASKLRLTSGTLRISKVADGEQVIMEHGQNDFELSIDGSNAMFEVDSSLNVNTRGGGGTNWWFKA